MTGARVEDQRFEAVWCAHGPAVVRYCTYSTGSKDAGEDVAAETFARFLANGERVPDERVEAWLIRVAHNLCASHHRELSRQLRIAGRVAEATRDDEDGWTRPDSWEYVRHLRETERLAVYLRVVEGRSFAEVARLLGKSESAAKMTFYRAIERLRTQMDRDRAGGNTTLVGGADSV